MATSSRLAGLIDVLPNIADKRESLDELKTLLTATNEATLRDVVPNVSFNAIFECLNTTDEAQLGLCCDVLELLLTALEPSSLLAQFQDELLAGLGHPAPAVKQLALKQMYRAACYSSQSVGPYEDILIQLVHLLSDESLAVAEAVIKIIKELARSSEGLHVLFQPNMQLQFLTSMEKGDTIKFRVYETLVGICCVSEEGLEQCVSAGFLQKLVNEAYQDDVLLQLNCLELLKDLALSPHGLIYLDAHGVVGKLEEMLNSVEDNNPMAALLLPGLVKFFGNVAHIHPKEICDRFQRFATLVFSLAHSPDITLRTTALETVGFIGVTPEGKMALQKRNSDMTSACQQIGKTISETSSDIRNKALAALMNLVTLQVADQTAELLSVTESWFKATCPRPIEMLMKIVQQPFPELRCHVLAVFAAVASTPWGQHMLNAHPGFNEYILDRNTEKSKETKEAKYAVVKTLSESPTSLDIFGRPYHMRLQQFCNEGPFYIRVEAAVAFEEAS